LKKHRIKKPPIPVAQIERALGAEVRYSPFDGELAGMLVRGEGETIIGVNSLHHPYRQRFTIAHECGHLLFHNEAGADRALGVLRGEGARLQRSRLANRRPTRGEAHRDPRTWCQTASVRFVTGGLDLVADRSAFLDLAQQAKTPILAVYGDQTPAKSRAEMEALSVLPNVSVKRLPAGKLSIHEEFRDAVAHVIMPFLSE
jgi:hypothetical protein